MMQFSYFDIMHHFNLFLLQRRRSRSPHTICIAFKTLTESKIASTEVIYFASATLMLANQLLCTLLCCFHRENISGIWIGVKVFWCFEAFVAFKFKWHSIFLAAAPRTNIAHWIMITSRTNIIPR